MGRSSYATAARLDTYRRRWESRVGSRQFLEKSPLGLVPVAGQTDGHTGLQTGSQADARTDGQTEADKAGSVEFGSVSAYSFPF